jgi:hypothetical protein
MHKQLLGRLAASSGCPRPTDIQMPDWSRFDLSVQEIKKKIEELNVARSRRRKWLVGTSLCALGITIVCLLIARNAAVSLLQDGPTHDEFVADLTRQFTKQILPQMDGFGIQASYGALPLPDVASPIPHSHASSHGGEIGEVHGPSSGIRQSLSTMGVEKANAGICGAADDPQKPMGRFREQTVTEYQATVTRIVNDLAAIRGREGNDNHAGLSAGAVASLFVSRVQDGLPKPSLEDNSPQADPGSSKDAR